MNQLPRLLFVINEGAGVRTNIDWNDIISNYFENLPYVIEFFVLPHEEAAAKLKKKIADSKPQKVVAVGGDGTVSMVAHEVRGTEMQMGIIPAGSANGMAKELGIPEDASMALGIIVSGVVKKR